MEDIIEKVNQLDTEDEDEEDEDEEEGAFMIYDVKPSYPAKIIDRAILECNSEFGTFYYKAEEGKRFYSLKFAPKSKGQIIFHSMKQLDSDKEDIKVPPIDVTLAFADAGKFVDFIYELKLIGDYKRPSDTD